ncbi:hypothetical protein JCM30471_29250 [Desulfuromonas carbonis]|uniref:hypothetical protein n=1 Tax=Desulfuromonas sp. DDH964 TaxID=1823759 RepID=UPI00078CC050|nr:hypothetical protein [Desulfuromonas sp. DDH964]AMV71104.1 hypothetical protein DBW_0719 [Desulfuromonas sp. DDH964]
MPPLPQKPKRDPRLTRTLATIYGIAMVNIGAFFLYDSLTAPRFALDTNFRVGFACLMLGAIALFFVRRSRNKGD